jgi:DNA-directed RNA polymerase subunit RPC12/RpoP
MGETKFTPRFCADCGSDETNNREPANAPSLHLDGKLRCRECMSKRWSLEARLGDDIDLYDALKALTPPSDDWWCPVCQTALDGSRVTNDERCDTCGTSLGGSPDVLTRARAALARARGETP